MHQPRRDQGASQAAPPVLGLGLEAIQGMTNAMNAIANQVIRSSGRSGRNAGWPYFDGTYRDYPAFKRKVESFRMTYHRGTPTQELFQQFREMCLPEKLSIKIKSANNMENAWVRLDAWFGDKALFIKDLLQHSGWQSHSGPSGTRSFTTQSPSSRQTADWRPRRGASSSTGRSIRSR